MSASTVGGRTVVNTHVTSDKPPMEGRHSLRIETSELREYGDHTKVAGQQYLLMRCRITAGPDQGKTVFHRFNLEGNFRAQYEQLCVALGVDGRDDFAVEDFIGGEFEAELKHGDEYNGRSPAEIKKVYVQGEIASNGGVKPQTRSDFPFPS
jgi:hypothetical protein